MSQQDPKDFVSANQALWDVRTDIHVESDFYDVPAFKAGNITLMPTELEALGDVTGKKLLHLQCHFGQDTLSWKRLGAEVTGVDFSENALEKARGYASELGLKARFIQSDILKLDEKLDEQFDIVFTSYGTIGWLPDINKWAEIIHKMLKPNGVFLIAEFHPYFSQINEKEEIVYDYFSADQPDEETAEYTYTDGPSHPPMKEYWWNHSLSDVVMALQNAGLSIESFQEFPYSHYKLADSMVEVGEKKFVYKNLAGRIPYMYAIEARKK
jgi:ubiquinone/menaquinone biosynthesis C-methylase UbiE